MDKNNSSFLKGIWFIAIVLAGIAGQVDAQTLQRLSVASGGTSAIGSGMVIQQTIGQPYVTQTFYDNEVTYRPGFQQSAAIKLEPVMLQSALSLDIFPNPAVSTVNINTSELISNATIKVTDMEGKLILNEKISELQTFSIHCENWANGTYLINVSDSQNKKYISKLIINK